MTLAGAISANGAFQPFLRFYGKGPVDANVERWIYKFQPFLRFYAAAIVVSVALIACFNPS